MGKLFTILIVGAIVAIIITFVDPPNPPQPKA